ncbi:MAG: hypothetical protein IKQ81_03340 [Clostridiales bacterium]|nr:hypothetical protein [Clostridiales bacterium]
MKICTFCGNQAENSAKVCTSCGSKQFNYICPNCSKEFEGKFCPACGTNFNAVAKTCPKCGRKYFSKACPDCGYSEFMETVQPQAPVTNAGYRNALNGAPSDRKAMPAFVAGLLGFMMFMPPLSVAAIIMSARGRKKEDIDQRSKMYYDLGLALGVVGLVLFIMMFAVMIFGGAASVMSEYYRK